MGLIDEEAELVLEPLLALVLFLLTILSLLFSYLYWWASSVSSLFDGVVFAVTFAVIMGAHEIGHFIAAKRRGFAVSFPMFIPFPVVFGTLGAIIAIKERPPNRRAMLEMALAGPLFGFFAMLVVLGLFSIFGDDTATGGPLGAPLLMYASTWLLGVECVPATGSSPILHGVWLSCVVTGLNLIPLRGLDGGRMFQALGRSFSGWQEKAVLAGLLFLGLYYWAGWWVWIFVILCMRHEDAHVADAIRPIEKKVQILAWTIYAVILSAVSVIRPIDLSSGIDLFLP